MKVRIYDPETGEYSEEQSLAGHTLHRYTSPGSITISKRWFPSDYPIESKEGTIQTQVLRAIKDADIWAVRLPVEGVTRRTGPDTAVRQGSPIRGWPDILCVLRPNGQIFGMEVKRVGGNIKTTQLGILSDMIRHGGQAAIICSAEGVQKALLGAAPIHFLQHPGLSPIPVY